MRSLQAVARHLRDRDRNTVLLGHRDLGVHYIRNLGRQPPGLLDYEDHELERPHAKDCEYHRLLSSPHWRKRQHLLRRHRGDTPRKGLHVPWNRPFLALLPVHQPDPAVLRVQANPHELITSKGTVQRDGPISSTVGIVTYNLFGRTVAVVCRE